MRLSSNMIGNSDYETNFPHKLLLTNKKVENICKVFANNSSTDIKLSKTQLSKMIQSGGFLGRSIPVSAVDAGINKKFLGSGTQH